MRGGGENTVTKPITKGEAMANRVQKMVTIGTHELARLARQSPRYLNT